MRPTGWLSELPRSPDGVLPVIWQSITQLYWPAEEVAAVESVLSGYGAQHPLARVSLEFAPGEQSSAMPELTTSVWRPGVGAAPSTAGRGPRSRDTGPAESIAVRAPVGGEVACSVAVDIRPSVTLTEHAVTQPTQDFFAASAASQEHPHIAGQSGQTWLDFWRQVRWRRCGGS